MSFSNVGLSPLFHRMCFFIIYYPVGLLSGLTVGFLAFAIYCPNFIICWYFLRFYFSIVLAFYFFGNLYEQIFFMPEQLRFFFYL